MRPLALIALATLLSSAPAHADEGRALVRRALKAHRAHRLAAATVDFRFRGTPYRMTRVQGRFTYERWVKRGKGAGTHEALDNDGFRAIRGGQPAELAPAKAAARGRSLNSVVYFASLPYGLEDPAVRPRALGKTKVRGRAYDLLEVRFTEAGGGADHDDVFRYWLEPETGRIAYLAYVFHTGRGGVRFRVATDYKTVGGVTFIQWDNHGADGQGHPSLDTVADRWAAGALPKLSEIRLEDIRVR